MEGKTYDGAIEFALRLMEGRDLFTHMHQSRTAELAVRIAACFESDESLQLLHAQGAQLHDIGKMHLPIELLTKPGRISETEYQYLKYHVEFGERLIEPLGFPDEICDIVSMHHERMDGSGYPRGLKNGAIPMHARVACVADMVEAMLADRPYRRGLGVQRMLDIVDAESGIKLDKQVVDALHGVIEAGTVEWLN